MFLFYAGHGLQVSSRNYLLPIDAKRKEEADLDFEFIGVSVVRGPMERAAKRTLIFLDACRDNPLARSLARNLGTRSVEVGSGLAEEELGVDFST